MNKNRDLYKRFVTFVSGILLLAMLTGIFAFVWYKNYSGEIVLPYYRRGNWVLIACWYGSFSEHTAASSWAT